VLLTGKMSPWVAVKSPLASSVLVSRSKVFQPKETLSSGTLFPGLKSPSFFATTRMDPRNETHDDDVLSAWFIFNLYTKILFLFT
jgi:hypothetical protein